MTSWALLSRHPLLPFIFFVYFLSPFHVFSSLTTGCRPYLLIVGVFFIPLFFLVCNVDPFYFFSYPFVHISLFILFTSPHSFYSSLICTLLLSLVFFPACFYIFPHLSRLLSIPFLSARFFYLLSQLPAWFFLSPHLFLSHSVPSFLFCTLLLSLIFLCVCVF